MKMRVLLAGILVAASLMGCGVRDAAADYEDVADYTAEVADTITVSDGTTEYVVLEQTVENSELGAWIGRVDAFSGNLYVSSVNSGIDGEVSVMVNGVNYRAKRKDALTDTDLPLNPSNVSQAAQDTAAGGGARVNEGNMDEVYVGDRCYLLSGEEVEQAQLGNMIAFIGMSYVVNTDTKTVIPQDELGEIVMSETDEIAPREQRMYEGIYSLNDRDDAIVVVMNNHYFVATSKE
ncbi:MAG: NisI/SpaI family lantibiotic immunity lipoprotein [Lachnospiraceae bacterium]|nr:NisI/SpaI family lantibiotic immunity lipoprotein [Lachnospiraceae bacterium]